LVQIEPSCLKVLFVKIDFVLQLRKSIDDRTPKIYAKQVNEAYFNSHVFIKKGKFIKYA